MNLRETLLQTVWVLIAAATVCASPVGDCPPVDPLDHTDHLPDSKNCSLFYKCDHAEPVLFECPDGLHFNRDLQVCDWPNRAGCSGGSTAGTTEAPVNSTSAPASSTVAPDPSEDCPAIGTCPQYEDENSIPKHLPHASNCSQFCKCDHGKPVKFDCPAGLHFNPALEVCDWPYRAGCADGSGPTQAPSSPKPATTTAATTAAPTSAAPTSAAPTTAAPTSAPSTTAKPSPAPSEDCPAIGTCPQYEDENSIAKHLPHASNCSQFCKCDHGKPVKFDCPAGLHFNPALEVCDWPYRAGCAGGSGSTQAPSSPKPATTTAATTAAPTSAAPTSAAPTTAAPTSAPSTTAKPSPAPSEDCPAIGTCPQYEDENSIAKHLPHASNCSQFCKCDHGKPVKFDCPAGLHFNPALEVCDWPYRAGCAGGSGPTQAPSSPKPATTTAATTAAPTSAAPTSAAPTTTAPTSAPSTTAKPSPAPSEDCPAIGTCPQYEDENSIAKHLPHASNCSQFCKCDHGKPVKFDCPAGLHFNPALEVCDWPYRAGCAGGSGPTQAPSSPKPATTTAATTAAPTSAAPTSAAPTTAAPTSEPSTTAKPSPAPSEDCPAIGTCPQYEDENSIAKHLPHASNCSQFCKCDHGKPVKFDCPAGLHFNPALEVCDWPYRAGCAGGSGPTQAPSSPKPATTTAATTAAPTSAAPTSAAPTTAAPTSEPSTTAKPSPAPSEDCPAIGTCPQYEDENSIAKHLPHASNCSQFCKCDHGKPVKFDCPAGLHFNPALEVCDWPYRAGCAGGSGPTQAPSSPKPATTTAATTAAPTSAAPTSAAPTTAAPTSEPSTTAKPSPAPSEDCPAIGTCPQYEDENSIAKHLPHASNCSQFCKCDHGKPVKFDCPAGLHFNPALEVCDWPYRAGCAGGSGPTQAPSSPKPATTTAATTAAPTSAAPTSAAPTTAAPTSEPSTTAKPSPAPSEDCPAIGTCPQYEDENSIAKHLPHASNCSQFCKCDHGKPVKFDCPAGLHFNPALEVCDWSYRAGCAGGSGPTQAPSSPKPVTTTAATTAAPTSAPSTTAKPTPAPSRDCPAIGSCPQNEDENSIAKHLPHASDCTQFCKCDHGKPVTFDCPAGLHFNPSLEVCDWPYRAGCASVSK